MFRSLFGKTNLVENFKLINKLNRLLGLGLNDVSLNSDGKMEMKLNKGAVMWSVVLHSIFIWCSYKAISCTETLIGFVYHSNLYFYNEYILTIFNCILSVKLSHVDLQRQKMVKFFRIGQEVDMKLQQLGKSINFATEKSAINVILFINIVLNFIRFLGIYLPFIFFNIPKPIFKICCLMFSINNSYLFLTLIYYGCTMVQERIKLLNEILSAIIAPKFKSNKKIAVGKVTGNQNPAEVLPIENILEECKYIHLSLYKLCILINNLSGICSMLHVLYSFFLIVFHMFYLIRVLTMVIIPDKQEFWFFIIYIVIEVSFAMYQVLGMVFNFNKVVQEAAKTPNLVNEIINMDLNAQASRKAEQLSLMTLHSMPSFTAFGMFTLDIPFLLSFIGSVTSYLIILLQIAAVPGNESLFSSNATTIGVATMC